MKLIDVDSKATLEDFLTFKKRLKLYSFYGNVMKKSVASRMSLRSDKDVETYLLKCRSDDNEKMSCYRQFIRVFNFYKEDYIHDIPFFLNFYKKKLFTLKQIFLWICNIFVQITPSLYFHTTEHVT
jgi:hypothetical protein